MKKVYFVIFLVKQMTANGDKMNIVTTIAKKVNNAQEALKEAYKVLPKNTNPTNILGNSVTELTEEIFK